MFHPIRLFMAISAGIFVLTLTACTHQTTPRPLLKESGSTSPHAGGGVPAGLVTIEEQAEDIIDFVPVGDWTKVTGDVTKADRAWTTYQPQAATDNVSQILQDALTAALTRLQTASSAEDANGTMQAANDLSAAVIDLFEIYHPVVPADIGRLDVLERQVILDVATNNFTAAVESLAQTKTVWNRIKPSVLSHNGADVASQFDASLTVQTKALAAKETAALTTEADNGLELVDDLEKIY